MGVPFPDIDPYETLCIDKTATPIEVKKSYKKLCLKFHPDKIQQTSSSSCSEDGDKFAKIQFSYSVLSDPTKRLAYDATGALHDFEDSESFNWFEYFQSINNKISIEMIEEDKLTYQNSEEEVSDIVNNFVYYEGDFLKLFETIPHLEFTESEESRVFDIVDKKIESKEIDLDASTLKTWGKYKKSRKTKVKQMLNKLAKEAKQAEILQKKILSKKQKLKTNDDLLSIIKSRQSDRLDNLINSLESKYAPKSTKRPKDLLDDQFDQIQKKLKSSKR
jgi:DnaJ family protein C protein 9